MAIQGIQTPVVPFGSWVIVTGVSGLIASHVADQALSAGYKVRGTTRSTAKTGWVKDHLVERYGIGSFELIEVPDMEAQNAFDEVVRGAAGFFHVAHDMNGSRDPRIAIPRAVHGAINALTAASKEPSMRRFVYTSSSFAATLPKPEKRFTISSDTWNDEAIERVRQLSPDGETVYAASKVEAERAIYKWIDDHKPGLVVNTICPNANIGPLISSENQGYPTSSRWVKALWESDYASLQETPAQHFVNVQDDARLHVIALTDPNVSGERIFPIAGPVNLNDIIGVMRKIYPGRTWEDFPDDRRDLSIFEPSKRAEQLLKEAYGVGFTGLEESVKGNAADLR